MLNHKKDLYVAGVFALCTLAACSSDNPSTAGSTTIPNATADGDTVTLEGNELVIPELMDLCYSSRDSSTNQDSATYLCGADEDFSFYSKVTAF